MEQKLCGLRSQHPGLRGAGGVARHLRALPVRQDLGNLVGHTIRQMGLCDGDRPLERVGPFSRVKALVAPKGQVILIFMVRRDTTTLRNFS